MHQLESQIFFIFGFLHLNPGIILPWVVTVILSSVCYFFNRDFFLVPTKRQLIFEYIVGALNNFIGNIVGEKHSKELIPILSTIFLYIFIANLLVLVPGLKSPTSIFSNCLGMALIVFFATHYLGFKHHGFKYFKHFLGSPWWLGPMMFPIHVIGELSRPLSLTLRLFGNIMGEDMVLLVLTVALFPLLVPVPFFFMVIFTSFLQALVFTILSSVYLSVAVATDESH